MKMNSILSAGLGETTRAFTVKLPPHVEFGLRKADQLADFMHTLFPKLKPRILLICSPRTAHETALSSLTNTLKEKGYFCSLWAEAVTEPTVENIDQAAALLSEFAPDVFVAVGGGSVIDTAKALALLATNRGSIRDFLFGGDRKIEIPPLPIIALPTTAGSGSEITGSCVISDTKRGVKLSVTDNRLIPRIAVVDPLLHVGMPAFVTASTGMDALTHAIEAYVSKNANPISDAFAEKAIELIGTYLRVAVVDGGNIEARSGMAQAAVLGAMAFLNAGLGAVHGISQSVSGVIHSAHGVTNAVLLPIVMRFNIPGNPMKFARIASILGEQADDTQTLSALAVTAVDDLSKEIGIPRRLSDLGLQCTQFKQIVESTMQYRMLSYNPVPVTRQNVQTLLQAAF